MNDIEEIGKTTINGEVIIVAKKKGMDTNNRQDSFVNESDQMNVSNAVTPEQNQNNKKRKKNM